MNESIRVRLPVAVLKGLERVADDRGSYPSTLARKVLTDFVNEQAPSPVEEGK